MSLRVGLITTLSTNIGDDFIRTGLLRVVRQVFPGKEIEFVAVNKHEPYTAYPAWHPVRIAGLAKYLPRGKGTTARMIESMLATAAFSRFEDCAAVLQCGAPVLWPNCHECEWAGPLWHRIVGRLHERIPVFNLAAGSCYPWERQPSTVDNQGDAEFLTAIHGYCRLTTVRDRLSHHLFDTLGISVPHIPCSALLAADERNNGSNGDGPILINYMPGGGHYDFGQGVDGSSWQETMRGLVARLKRRHRVEFLCHSQKELDAAAAVADGLPCHLPKTVAEYFDVAAGAKAGVFNRMHASVGLAGLGIPSIAIGTDTRLLMVEHIGLPCFYVKDAGMDIMEQKVEDLLLKRKEEKERLLGLRQETTRRYIEAVSHAWS
jgi:hypothetical protein